MKTISRYFETMTINGLFWFVVALFSAAYLLTGMVEMCIHTHHAASVALASPPIIQAVQP